MSSDDLAVVLRGVRDHRGVLHLLQVLGLEKPVRRRTWRLPAGCGASLARCVAARSGMDAWLLEGVDAIDAAAAARVARLLARREPFSQQLVVVVSTDHRQLLVGALNSRDEFRHLDLESAQPCASDIDTLMEMVAAPGEGGLALAARYARALDRERVGRRFFEELRLHRARIAAAWSGIRPCAASARARLALLLLCRLLFLYFLQRRGHLAGNGRYFADQLRRWRMRPVRGSFYRAVLRPLFFGVLNRRPEKRDRRAAALGPLPYLNGGLFERSAVERAHPRLDIADAALLPLFDELLERYRFTTTDAAETAAAALPSAGIDPEMLGRIFEGLMAAGERVGTGTYFTPPGTVDRIVREALTIRLAASARIPERLVAVALDGDVAHLDAEAKARLQRAIRALRVLDPACGSGAFLLSVLSRAGRLSAQLDEEGGVGVRRVLVANALHGVDAQADAALLCALRLWLALATEADARDGVVPPLPNLDRRILQGDSLIDPLDLGCGLVDDEVVTATARSSEIHAARRTLVPDAERYAEAPPEERAGIAQRLARAERRLARNWFAALRARYVRLERELHGRAAERDLFGAATADALRAAGRIPELVERRRGVEAWQRRLRRRGELPFFSYAIHFASAAARGFDVIVANPPWLRAHRWAAGGASTLRHRYEVCRRERPGDGGGQVDLALLFLERSLRLCADRGTLGFVLPAKLLRSSYAGAARRMMLRETRIAAIDDHSLDHRAIFTADAFAATIIAQRTTPLDAAPVRIRMTRHGSPALAFEATAADLPLDAGDRSSPWLIAPPRVRAALRRMQSVAAGVRASGRDRLVVRRGVVTGANDVLVVRDAQPRLGELVQIRCEGWYRNGTKQPAASFEGVVERTQLRPLLRGAAVDAWCARPDRHVIWMHGDGAGCEATPRLRRFLAPHAHRLARGGRLQRVCAAALGPKVVWQDIAQSLNACALPATMPSPICGTAPIVPLNTVYYVACDSFELALLLAGLLNSLPVRVFACAIAERAKDARFRFFAGTVAALPLPPGWSSGPLAASAGAASDRAHRAGSIGARDALFLDETVAEAFGLGTGELDELRSFACWLRGSNPPKLER